MHEDSAEVHSVDDQIAAGLQSAKCEEQELNKRQAILPFVNADIGW